MARSDLGIIDGQLKMQNQLIDGYDPVTGAMLVIENDHREIHEKSSFTTHYENDVTTTNHQTVIAFNAPATKEVHLIITVESTHATDVYLYRDTSITVGQGTELDVVCRNQVATLGTSLVTSIVSSPVANKMTSLNESQVSGANITTTTELDHMPLLGGKGPKALGALDRGSREWVFSGGTQVAIVIKAGTSDGATHKIRLDWYEHTSLEG